MSRTNRGRCGLFVIAFLSQFLDGHFFLPRPSYLNSLQVVRDHAENDA